MKGIEKQMFLQEIAEIKKRYNIKSMVLVNFFPNEVEAIAGVGDGDPRKPFIEHLGRIINAELKSASKRENLQIIKRS